MARRRRCAGRGSSPPGYAQGPMDLAVVHGLWLGLTIVVSWLVICLWALGLRVIGPRGDTPTFWRAVALAQTLLAVQLLVVAILLALRRWPGPDDGGAADLLFHLGYGAVFTLVVLVVAHSWARTGRYNAHAVFSLVGLVNFGLTLRAWQVGILGA